MSQLFRPSINIIANITLLAIVLILAGSAGLIYFLVKSPYMTEVGLPKAQPAPFSHRQHVGGLGLDCRYCHASVEEGDFAGIPFTETCMGCHTQVAPEASSLAVVRESAENNQPIEWIRVHDLADVVYFNHSIHVRKGVGCETCHGRVDKMPLTWQKSSLQMEWCLDCHRHPERHVRRREDVFKMGYEPPGDQETLGRQLVKEYRIESRMNCSTCHR